MGRLASEVRQSRVRRDTARTAFNTRLAQVRQELNTRSLAGRLADKLEVEARETLEIAQESKGVLLGTAATLALWYLRNPLLSWFEGLLASMHGKPDPSVDDEAPAPQDPTGDEKAEQDHNATAESPTNF